MKRFAITTGDTNGIGFEVSSKALFEIGPRPKVQFVLFRSPQSELKYLKLLKRKFDVQTVQTKAQLDQIRPSKTTLIDFVQNSAPPFWVQQAAELCSSGDFAGMITAPLSKELIQSSGFEDAKGHTEILKKVANVDRVYMVFIGKHFNVLLATGHIPLHLVEKHLADDGLARAIKNALLVRKLLPQHQSKKPVAVLGLNPHAGENGLLGKQEIDLFRPQLASFRNQDVVGPLPPDVAFKKENWGRFSVFVCAYHDQGLIPFKLVHGTESGYHLTFGLPFVRTSVDHGTAFDIFGKNKADPSSMIEAVRACLALAK